MNNKIKSKVFLFFELINPALYGFWVLIFRFVNRLKGRPKLLVFTDSRGFEVTKFWNRKNPFSSYIGKLILDYECHVQVCPEKFTSLLDFLTYYESLKVKKFDKVVLHCGIVDFAPRPESSFDQMFNSKFSKLEKFSILSEVRKENRAFGTEFEGEKTMAFLSESALQSVILPKLTSIPNLIYISINPVLNDWKGNYWRHRPTNINEQLELDKLIKSSIREVVDLSILKREEIMSFTSDNVHYKSEGFDYIYTKLKSFLPQV